MTRAGAAPEYSSSARRPTQYAVRFAPARGPRAVAAVARALALEAHYTWTRTAATDSGYDGATYAAGQPLLRRPAHSGSATVSSVLGGRAGASLSAYWVGRRADEDYSGATPARVTLPAYVRFDLAGHVELVRGHGAAPSVTATLKAENLLDARYEEVLLFPARRRAVYVGLQLEGGT